MNIQVTASHSDFNVSKVFNSHSRSSMLRVTPPDVFNLRTEALKLTINGAPIYPRKILPNTYMRSRYQRCPPVCLFGGKGRPENDDESSPWKSIEKGMGNLKKEQSVEDALRQQIEKQEYYDDGGSGGNRSGGGGGSSSGGSGRSGDGGFLEFLDELLQVILAAAGLIFVYRYLIDGEDWPYIVRDYIKLLFGAKMSFRVRKNNEWWVQFYEKRIKKYLPKLRLFGMPVPRVASLENAIANTSTWWDKPIFYQIWKPPQDPQLVDHPRRLRLKERYRSRDNGDGPEVDINRIFDDSSESESESEFYYRKGLTDDSNKQVDDELGKEVDDENENEYEYEYSGMDKEVDDEDGYSGSDEEGELEDSDEEEDSFESYLVEGDKVKEDEDFLSILDRIDMSKAERLASESSDSESEGGNGKEEDYLKQIHQLLGSDDEGL